MKDSAMGWLALVAWSFGAFGLVAGLSGTDPTGEALAQQDEQDAGVSVREIAVPTTPVEPLDEARSAHLVTTLDSNEMTLARMATMRANRADVRQLANAIIRDHGAVQDRLTRWTEDYDVAPLGSPFSDQVATSASAARLRLDAASSRDFDRVFLETQIAIHVDSLRLIDERVLPGARNASFRALVEQLRRDEERHLAAAQRL